MVRRTFIGTALAVALCLAWLAWDGWLYLQRGYSIGVAMQGRPASFTHIDFPAWRAAAHLSLSVAAMAAIAAYVTGRHWASSAAWLTFAATLLIGLNDVEQYGTMGSRTSIWTLLLLLLVVLLTRFAPPPPMAKA